jgi:hypothetical protein
MKSKKKRQHGETSSRGSDKEMKTTYSIREIADLPIFMLNQMIFTFERKLNDKDMTQAQTIDTKLDILIKGLKCMKGIDEEFIPTFKFF